VKKFRFFNCILRSKPLASRQVLNIYTEDLHKTKGESNKLAHYNYRHAVIEHRNSN
jgi:hypothetical protein